MEKDFNCDWMRDVLSELYGEIVSLTEECPGVCHISVRENEMDVLLHEYYIVEKTSAAISREAKAYGQPVEGHTNLLAYSLDQPDSGQKIIAYEVYRYRLQRGLPTESSDSLHDVAVYSAEYHPDYFGLYPAPLLTPRGYMLCYKALDNGIFWLETDRCESILAVCYPIWDSELSDAAIRLGEQTEFDRKNGIENTLGYLFFPQQASCIPLFELMLTRKKWESYKIVDRTAVMNAIWRYYPEYAIANNCQEQAGLHSLAELLFGTEVEPSEPDRYMITLSSEEGS